MNSSSAKVSIVKSNYANLYSVHNALLSIGIEAQITSGSEELINSDYLICPGVGSFSQVKNYLDDSGLTYPIMEFIKTGKPFLGICVGMQILFELGYEGDTPTKGLGVMKGEVVLLPKQVKRIPHIGWNSLITSDQNSAGAESLLGGLSKSKEVYFVHSYYCSAKEKQDVLAYVEPVEGLQVPAMVKKNNVYGVQFHPERSGDVGLKILSNFLKL